jgi:uncharacterized protein YciI
MIRIRGAILAALLAVAAPSAFAQPAPAAGASQAAPLYLCIYRAGPAWKVGEPVSAQALGPHFEFIKRLLDEGRLFAGGGMDDVAGGGLAIFRAASVEEARAIFAADPALATGLLVGEIHAWYPRFDSGKPLRPQAQ